MNKWDEAEKKAEEHKGSSMFFQLEPGESAVVAFIGEPEAFELVWTGDKYVPYDADKHSSNEITLRVKINVFNTGMNRMQIFDMNRTTFSSVLKLKNKYGLEKQLYEIENVSTPKKKGRFAILPDEKIDKDLARRIANEEPLNLFGDNDKNDNDSDSSPDEKNRELLKSMLRSLPKSKLQEFLTRWEVGKISQIPDKKLLDALASAKSLKSEKDPFDDDLPF